MSDRLYYTVFMFSVAWTQDGIIQTHIDVYLSEATFSVVKRAFPFLVSKEFATGGGDVSSPNLYFPSHSPSYMRYNHQVAAFRWHIIDYGVPFEILETGITITPLAGRPFPIQFCVDASRRLTFMSVRTVQHGWLQPRSSNKPYLCFGFNIQDTVIYISDGNHIPEETWALLEHSLPTSSKSQSDSTPSTLATTTKRKPYPVLVLDCLHLIPYTAHFGIVEAVNVARRMGALRTYVTDIGHYVGHDEWVAIGESLERMLSNEIPEHELGDKQSGITEVVRRGLNMVREADREAHNMLEGEEERRGIGEGTVWLRPAHDGLRLVVSKEGVLEDGTYGA